MSQSVQVVQVIAAMAVSAVLSLSLFLVGVSSSQVLERFPSVVQVESLTSGVWSQDCSASIINNLYVLSAASCFSGADYSPELRRVRAGSALRGQGGLVYYVQKELNHPEFVVGAVDNDISVVRLASFLQFSSVISSSPIAGPTTSLPLGFPVIQAGWGSAGIQTNLSIYGIFMLNSSQCNLSSLQQVLCGERYNRASYNQDVGSPWYVNNVISAVVSSTVGRNVMATPVGPYAQWIVENAV